MRTHSSAQRRTAGTSAPLTLLAACVGFFVIVLDTTVVNVALPSIGRDLHAGIAGLQWVVDGYVVVFAALLLSTGALSDRWGATRTFAAGLAGFAAASAACGMAPSLAVLLGARIVQGAAAALVLPASLAVVRQAYSDAAPRARAISIWTAGGGAAVAAGPVIGGLLTSTIGWRAIFFINLPVGLVGLAATTRAAPSPRRPTATDLPGQVAAILALGALSIAIIEGAADGIMAAVPLTAAVIFIGASGSFVLIESRAASPMVPLGLFRSPVIASATITGLVLNLAFYGQVFVLSLFFQQLLGRSPVISGLMFLPMTALVTATNISAGRLTARFGPRLPLLLGQAILASALLGLSIVHRHSPTLAIELLLVPIGVGGGLTIPPLTSALMDAVPNAQAGVAAGVLNAARQLGGALGVAINGALIGGGFMAGMRISLVIGAGATIATAGLVAVCFGRSSRGSTRDAAGRARHTGLRSARLPASEGSGGA